MTMALLGQIMIGLEAISEKLLARAEPKGHG